MHPRQNTDTPQPGTSGAENAQQLNILVAEDNPTNRFVFERMFKKLGHTIEMVEDGRAAVQQACNKSYHIIFMDIQMPHTDGLEATKEITDWYASQGKTRPVIIALTADTTREEQQRCLMAGMNDYLSKPLDFEKLDAILKKWSE